MKLIVTVFRFALLPVALVGYVLGNVWFMFLAGFIRGADNIE